MELHPARVERLGRVGAAFVSTWDGLSTLLSLTTYRGVDALRELRFSPSEFRVGFRLMRKQPLATITSALSLAVGIGLAAGGASVVREVLFGALPFENGDRFTLIRARSAETAEQAPIDLERLDAFRVSANALAYIGGVQVGSYNLVHSDGSVEAVEGAALTPGLLAHVPIAPMLGRSLTAEDGTASGPRVVVVRESLWERGFDRTPSVLGSTLELGGEEFVVVGVMPDTMTFPNEGEVWIPIPEATHGAADQRTPIQHALVGILAPGATVAAAAQQLDAISDRVSVAGSGATPMRFQVTPMARMLALPQVQAISFVAIFLLVAVLLIAAANVANLVVARTSRRSAEIGVRRALGASRSRIVGQLLSETLALATVAGVLGLVVAARMLRFYDDALDEVPFWIRFELDAPTVSAVVLLSLVATLAVGLLPALRATSGSSADTLRSAGTRSSMRVGRIGGLMIATEVALAVGLIGTAAVYALGFRAYLHPSVRLPADVMTAQIVPRRPGEGIDDVVADSVTRVVRAVERAVSDLPGTRAVGTAGTLPGGVATPARVVLEDGGQRGEPEDRLVTSVVEAGTGLLESLEIEVTEGRWLESIDFDAGAHPVGVVDQSFVRARWGAADVVGRRVRIQSLRGPVAEDEWIEIVGVVPDFMDVTGNDRSGTLFRPLRDPYYFQVAWRTDGTPIARADELRRALYRVDPSLEVSRIDLIANYGRENRVALLALSSTMSGVGVLAVLLALAGIYSIVSLTVSRRTREIGIRVALGATPRDVFISVVQRSVRLIALGSTLGVGLGVLFMRSRDLMTFVLPDLPAWLFPAVALGMLLVGAVAAWAPARRALAIRPVEAINHD